LLWLPTTINKLQSSFHWTPGTTSVLMQNSASYSLPYSSVPHIFGFPC
jgi:hypothetical protein